MREIMFRNFSEDDAIYGTQKGYKRFKETFKNKFEIKINKQRELMRE